MKCPVERSAGDIDSVRSPLSGVSEKAIPFHIVMGGSSIAGGVGPAVSFMDQSTFPLLVLIPTMTGCS